MHTHTFICTHPQRSVNTLTHSHTTYTVSHPHESKQQICTAQTRRQPTSLNQNSSRTPPPPPQPPHTHTHTHSVPLLFLPGNLSFPRNTPIWWRIQQGVRVPAHLHWHQSYYVGWLTAQRCLHCTWVIPESTTGAHVPVGKKSGHLRGQLMSTINQHEVSLIFTGNTAAARGKDV